MNRFCAQLDGLTDADGTWARASDRSTLLEGEEGHILEQLTG